MTKKSVNLLVLALLVLALGACAEAKNLLHKPHARPSEQNTGSYNESASRQAGYAVGDNEVAEHPAAVEPVASRATGAIERRDEHGNLIETPEQTVARLHLAVIDADNTVAARDAQIQVLLQQINSLQSQRSHTTTVSKVVMVNVPSGTTISGIWNTSYTNDYTSYGGLCAAFLGLNKGVTSCNDIKAGKVYAFPVPSSGRIILPSNVNMSSTLVAAGSTNADASALQEQIDSLAGRLRQAIADKVTAEGLKKTAEDDFAAANKRAAESERQLRIRTKERDDLSAEVAALIKPNWLYRGALILLALVLVGLLAGLFMSRRKAVKNYQEMNEKAGAFQGERDKLRMDVNKLSEDLRKVAAKRDEHELNYAAAQLDNKKLTDQLVEQQTMIDEHFITFVLDPGPDSKVRLVDASAKNRTKIYLPRVGKDAGGVECVKIEKTKVSADLAEIARYLHRSAGGRLFLQIELHPESTPSEATSPTTSAA